MGRVSKGIWSLVFQQIPQVGILLFQKSSSIPEMDELISPELSELYERSGSTTDANKIYSPDLSSWETISSDYLGKIDEREGGSSFREALTILPSMYFLTSW